MRLAFCVSVIVTMVLPLALIPAHADESKTFTQAKSVQKQAPTDWALLRFSDDRRIRRATIVMIKQRDLFGSDGFRPNGENIEIVDPKILRKIEAVFFGPPLRMATADDGRSGGGWGTFCFGRLEIETTDGRFFIAISYVGFHLNYDGTNYSSVFWSGPLARLIDDIYASRYKNHITYRGRSLAEQHASIALDTGGFSEELKLWRNPSNGK